MLRKESRRQFLGKGTSLAAALGVADLGFLSELRSVSAAETRLDQGVVRLRPEIEPVVQLLEKTPRERLLEVFADRIKRGLSYREVLAALLLAGVKNVEPRPSVGFKFHAVLVVNSAHLASISSPAEHRWLPIFWALDYYKDSAARDVAERGDWTMSAVNDARVPPAHKARQSFVDAMDDWDEGPADAAIAALARSAGANEIYELLFRYGARDFRSIGHKAIFVANSWRTLQCIGWQHAEPVLRSLAYALLNHDGGNPAKRDDEADRPFRRNQQLVTEIDSSWRGGKLDAAATRELLQTLRTGSNDEACEHVVRLLNDGVGPQSVWDAMHVAAGEMLMRQPGIIALHAVTTANAMRFAFNASGNDETRRLVMLQCAAFLPMFRARMYDRGRVKDTTIDDLQTDSERPTLDAIFADVNRKPTSAAEMVLSYTRAKGDAKQLIDAARVLVFSKGNNAHDYKFSSAALEDYYHVSPAWRNQYLATSVFNLRGSTDPDNSLVQRIRAALEGS